ncbi:LysR family transcriptional regulator [Mesorhizobium sp. NZP2077]|uniref:LysR family transcriptional regulator n=1 Tax=Mesorhizobium sp. NZP2077 TaxID=2483404 RepID=UPI0015571442|nr:LysR family transcriptional regulator [Mesorhizobium sp. NZP2077]QKD19632.1 LysR family transcriptional regulator [Mesorhizobium sp. NZP2077]
MVTLKQLETLHWIAQLGTFERAAAKLNTTQSAISKRIVELEASTRLALFDRSQRGARLTEQGEQLLSLGRDMLYMQQQILELKDAEQPPSRHLRLGVTEMCALSWLPRLVSAIQDEYPTVSLEPEVDMSRNLYDRLLEDTIDIIVIPEAFSDPEITSVRIAEVSNVWTARPGMIKTRRALDFGKLAEYTILAQGSRSGSSLLINKWLRANGIAFQRTISCDSLTAVIGLVTAGIGVSYLPQQCFHPLVNENKLAIVPVKPTLPPIPYAAMYRNDRPSVFTTAIADLAGRVCDFSFQGRDNQTEESRKFEVARKASMPRENE